MSSSRKQKKTTGCWACCFPSSISDISPTPYDEADTTPLLTPEDEAAELFCKAWNVSDEPDQYPSWLKFLIGINNITTDKNLPWIEISNILSVRKADNSTHLGLLTGCSRFIFEIKTCFGLANSNQKLFSELKLISLEELNIWQPRNIRRIIVECLTNYKKSLEIGHNQTPESIEAAMLKQLQTIETEFYFPLIKEINLVFTAYKQKGFRTSPYKAEDEATALVTAIEDANLFHILPVVHTQTSKYKPGNR